jgi:perosamine synthetase
MELPDVKDLLVTIESTLRDAMFCLERTAQGICFVVDQNDILRGILTDGDIRRAFLRGCSLATRTQEVMQTEYVSLPVSSKPMEIQKLLNHKIRHIPLTDDNGKVVDYACFHRIHKIPVMSPVFNGNELKYVSECIRTNWISSQGSYINKFEEVFRKYIGSEYSLAVSNGTTALHLAILALGIGPGDEVIIPDLTFAASINSVIYSGATPVLVDIDKETWTICPKSVEKAITKRTRAIMPVHLYGHPCDMDSLLEIAKMHHLFVVEDSAESLGSKYKGQMTGSLGDTSAFSFFGNKTITTGEGGMVVFKTKEAYEKAAVLRDHGMSKNKRYWHDCVGYNYRMTNLQAAVGVAQMERVEETVDAKRALAKKYNDLFRKTEQVDTPPEMKWAQNSFWLYTLLLKPEFEKHRHVIMKNMLLNGIDSRRVFYPLHCMPIYEKYRLKGCDYEVSKDISNRGMSLPSSKELSMDQINLIHRVFSDIIAQLKTLESCMP